MVTISPDHQRYSHGASPTILTPCESLPHSRTPWHRVRIVPGTDDKGPLTL
jgi:hypothetical protein